MKFKITLLLAAFIFIKSFSQTTVNFSWANGLGSAVNEAISGSNIDPAGNVYITGYINSTVDFDPVGTYTLSAANGAFLAKYNSNGNLIWANVLQGSGTSEGYSIRTNSINEVYLMGSFVGDVDFDPSASTTSLTGVADMFLAKYTSNGAFTWVKQIAAVVGASLKGNFMHVNASGDIFVAGAYDGMVDFDASASTYTLDAGLTNTDGFALKYDNLGNFSWAVPLGFNSMNEEAYGISEDQSGNVFVTGALNGVIDFDPTATTATLVSNGQEDIYIAKYSSAGNYLWAKSFGGANKDQGYRLCLTTAGDVIVTGNMQSPVVNFDPIGTYTLSKVGTGTNDSYFAKYSGSTGNFLWAKCTGGIGDIAAYNIALDSQDNIYLSGQFNGTVDLDYSIAGVANYTTITLSNTDIFFAKFDPTGNYIFAKQLGGGSSSGNNSTALNVDANNNIIIAGTYANPVDFDFSANNYSLTVYGSNDMYFAKYTQCISATAPTLSANSATICAGTSYTLGLSGTLNSATNWYWSDVACGTTTLGTGTTIVVSPTVSTQYFVRADGGCVTPTSCVSVSITATPSKNLIGLVTTNSITPVAGDIVLYRVDANQLQFDSITYQTLSPTGTFTFSSVTSNSYIIQCRPTNNTLQVTYNPNSTAWMNAGIITHGCVNTSTQNVNVIPLTNLGVGPGVLAGSITEGVGYGQRTNGISSPGAPIKGVIVKGGRNPGGDITSQSRTNAAGQYTLSGLPSNLANEEYFILVDIPGLDTNTTYHRIITTTNTQFTNLDFVVDSTKITPTNNFVGVKEVSLDKNKIRLYPNPTNGVVNIEFALFKPSNVTIEVMDVLGRSIKTILPVSYQNENEIKIASNLSGIRSGVYFVKIKIDNSEITTKLIITH